MGHYSDAYEYDYEQNRKEETIKKTYLVNLDKSFDGRSGGGGFCDVYIPAIDDFIPQKFDSEELALRWIKAQSWGSYTITILYEH